MRTPSLRRPPLLRLCPLAGLLLLCGCALFLPSESSSEPEDDRLRDLLAQSEAVALKVSFAERPLGHRILDQDVWTEVDQIGAVDPPVRQKLADFGFRLGIGGTMPGEALEELLKNPQMQFDGSDAAVGFRPEHEFPVREGTETEIQVSPFYPHLTIAIPSAGEQPPKRREFHNARCVLQIRAQNMQQGWTRLIVTPEIHHGTSKMRRVATQSGWTLRTSQEIERLFALQFEVKLNQGDMAVVSMTPNGSADPEKPGFRFFVGNDSDDSLQKLLVIRLTNSNLQQQVFIEPR